MSRLKKRDQQYSFITPRQSRQDIFKVYNKPFLGDKQFEAIQNKRGYRTIHVDPELVFRLATLGLTREMVGNYYGISKSKFSELCDEYPIIDEVYLMGLSRGIVKTAQKLEEMVDEKQLVPVIFRLKTSGFIEADKMIGKTMDSESAPRVNIFIPDNNRDNLNESFNNED
jgi:hypothetical protein